MISTGELGKIRDNSISGFVERKRKCEKTGLWVEINQATMIYIALYMNLAKLMTHLEELLSYTMQKYSESL